MKEVPQAVAKLTQKVSRRPSTWLRPLTQSCDENIKAANAGASQSLADLRHQSPAVIVDRSCRPISAQCLPRRHRLGAFRSMLTVSVS